MHTAQPRQPLLLRIAERVRGYYAVAWYFMIFGWHLLVLPLFDWRDSDERFRRRVQCAARRMLNCFRVRIRTLNSDALPETGPVILVANHGSWFDQLSLLAAVDLPIAFVANEKYFRMPILGRIAQRLGGIPTAGACAADGRQSTPNGTDAGTTASIMTGCQQALQKNRCVVIYPEGTRSEKLLPFRRGAAVLGQQTGLPLHPVVIHGAADILPRMQPLWKVRPGTITLQFLPTIPTDDGSDSETITSQLRSTIEAELETGAEINNQPAEPPPTDVINALQPSDPAGIFYTLLASGLTAGGIALSIQESWLAWACGQLLLAITMIQWWAILHEAGHKTLFRSRGMNRWVAHLAGFWSLIPGDCWRLVHARHHYWTGWQDRDMTTETLVPRQLKGYERLVINSCWLLWIPMFATLYRLNNYWNYPRLRKQFADSADQRLLRNNIVIYGISYVAIAVALGPMLTLKLLGAAIFITLALQDLLVLSQHTHIPMELAEEREIRPFTPAQQEVFTRSLQFPAWFSRLILLNLDAHGLHHMYPRVPGYRLHALQERDTLNTVPWWAWVIGAKSTPGTVLLFQNRDQTGFYY